MARQHLDFIQRYGNVWLAVNPCSMCLKRLVVIFNKYSPQSQSVSGISNPLLPIHKTYAVEVAQQTPMIFIIVFLLVQQLVLGIDLFGSSRSLHLHSIDSESPTTMIKRITTDSHPNQDDFGDSHQPVTPGGYHSETIQRRIERVTQDIDALETFYAIGFSPTTVGKLKNYYREQLDELDRVPFRSYNQQDRVDFLLLKNYLTRSLRRLELDEARDEKMKPLLGSFASIIIELFEARQNVTAIDPQAAAQRLHDVSTAISGLLKTIERGEIEIDNFSAFRAAKAVESLKSFLEEWFSFYDGYDPLFSWWNATPYPEVGSKLDALAAAIKEKILGLAPGDEDAIVGQPIGSEGLLRDLEAEVISYSPEELIQIGEKEYTWCESEMKKASRELGFGDDWRKALEHVKTLYVPPGKQPQTVRDLAEEAIEYVTNNSLVTVPPLAAETWRTFMLSPEQQKVAPFFLGGQSIRIAFPTSSMDHAAKLTSLHANNVHFSRAVVFHELIPGHHLQFYMNSRFRPYRRIFTTPFWVEGGALYWEIIFWDKGFPKTPENRIGMLFWRMHRCARIIFSLKFHLGEMTAQESIDFLVEKVGHERGTAEGEVRRSLNGDYSPLYQAGYMLGALQLYSLRREVVDSGKLGEKEFHDRILKENQMPIELLRALIQRLPLTSDYKSSWKFYDQ
ncbi:predicted protein [Uncinocarpus reesii 1704]|uniref:X-Pro dipeptidyl-peptidase n=1 Tax=Uncinocarpus reesii (strain UAMH 1704) TaxID=336963 RepID=C4JX19_UNCRE|nr:uncharacterized protein UREG_06192 [Uncinocarpus reesii 1704]EEP81327.1 predicted protein [Uncinocarpus reesii 1704]